MPNYQNGKIYKIIDSENKVIYIGSTTEKLCNRYAKHKHNANGNRIILLELCPCNSREELVKKEQELIEQFDNLLNQKRAYIPEEHYKEYMKEYHLNYNKEYYEENKNKILENRKINRENTKEKQKVYYEENKNNKLEKVKIYREEHKVEISEKAKVKLVCECGCTIRKYDMNKHKKTKKHIKLMESK